MKTSSAKAKGRRCAKELKEKLLFNFPDLEPDDIRVTPSGVTGPDLQLSPKAKKKFPFAIECKNVEKLNIWKALEQSESHTNHDTPLLVFTRNRSNMYVSLSLEEFLSLL